MRLLLSLRLCGLSLLVSALLASTAFAADTGTGTGRTIPVTITPALKTRGVAAGWAEVHADNPLMVSVYLTFSKPFEGKLELRVISSAGTEAARSAERPMNIAQDTGEPVAFTFPAGTLLSKSARVVVVDESGLPVQQPQKRKQSVGDEAKEIFNELIR